MHTVSTRPSSPQTKRSLGSRLVSCDNNNYAKKKLDNNITAQTKKIVAGISPNARIGLPSSRAFTGRYMDGPEAIYVQDLGDFFYTSLQPPGIKPATSQVPPI